MDDTTEDLPERAEASGTSEPADDNQAVRINEEKWGKAIWRSGWTGVPTVLLDAQARLGISADAMNVLMQLFKRWWRKDKLPFPSQEEIVEASGMKLRTVQRAMKELIDAGFVKRTRRRMNGGWTSNVYSFDGLLEHLQPIALEKLAAKSKTANQRDPAHRAITKKRARKKRDGGSAG